jgi:hypothetical protein
MANSLVFLGLLTAIGALANDDIEFWYVNVDGNKAREECMNAQLKNMDVEPHRHKAMKLLTDDCTAGGERKAFMTDYDEQTKTLRQDSQTRFHIISNWCSHKQLFSKLYNSSSKADFFMVMEDDTVMDDENFVPKLKEFINTYDGEMKDNWQMVQVDFYGSSCKFHSVGHSGGKTVFKPRNLFKQAPGFKKPLRGSQECSQYYGGQAFLVRRSEIPGIVENMETHPTVPLDWLPAQLPRGLAWKPNIAHNSRSYKTTKGFNKACNGQHFESAIAKNQGGTNPYAAALAAQQAAAKNLLKR